MPSVQLNRLQPGAYVVVSTDDLGQLAPASVYFNGNVDSGYLVVRVPVGVSIAVHVIYPGGVVQEYGAGVMKEGEYQMIVPLPVPPLPARLHQVTGLRAIQI